MLEVIRIEPDPKRIAEGSEIVAEHKIKLGRRILAEADLYQAHHATTWRTALSAWDGVQAVILGQRNYAKRYFEGRAYGNPTVRVQIGKLGPFGRILPERPLQDFLGDEDFLRATVNNPDFALFRIDMIQNNGSLAIAYDNVLPNVAPIIGVISEYNDSEGVAQLAKETAKIQNGYSAEELAKVLDEIYRPLPTH